MSRIGWLEVSAGVGLAFSVLGGCVVGPPPDEGPFPGNVEVLWQFSDGNNCGSLSQEVGGVQVSIPGQILDNGGNYPCDSAGTDGIELADFAPGSYTCDVTAVDFNGNPLYSGSTGFDVNGDTQVDVELYPVASSTDKPVAAK